MGMKYCYRSEPSGYNLVIFFRWNSSPESFEFCGVAVTLNVRMNGKGELPQFDETDSGPIVPCVVTAW